MTVRVYIRSVRISFGGITRPMTWCWSRNIFRDLPLPEKCSFWIKLTCEPDPSVVSFLPGLALMKTTVLKSMRTLSYFRLDTLICVYVCVYVGAQGDRHTFAFWICSFLNLSKVWSSRTEIVLNWKRENAQSGHNCCKPSEATFPGLLLCLQFWLLT